MSTAPVCPAAQEAAGPALLLPCGVPTCRSFLDVSQLNGKWRKCEETVVEVLEAEAQVLDLSLHLLLSPRSPSLHSRTGILQAGDCGER